MTAIGAEAEAQYLIEKASDPGLKAFITFAEGRGIQEATVKGLWINAFMVGWRKGLVFDLEAMPKI